MAPQTTHETVPSRTRRCEKSQIVSHMLTLPHCDSSCSVLAHHENRTGKGDRLENDWSSPMKCYHIRPSPTSAGPRTPALFGCLNCVCIGRRYPAISGNSAPPKLPAADQFRVIFLVALPQRVTQANHHHQHPRGAREAGPLPSQTGYPSFTSGFRFCSLLKGGRTIERLRPSWPP